MTLQEGQAPNKALTMYDVQQEPGAKEFLKSKSRRSAKTSRIYSVGLKHFESFLSKPLQSIIRPLLKGKTNVYTLLDNFVSYLVNLEGPEKLSPPTITLYVAAVRSFLQYYDVVIVPSKFKQKVTLPTIQEDTEEGLDAADIRKILLACRNLRLKTYMLVQCSGALRPGECCAIRLCDIDYTVAPTKVHVRADFSKRRIARDIYISDEATRHLKQYIDFRYRTRITNKKERTPTQHSTDLVFKVKRDTNNGRSEAEIHDELYDSIREGFVNLVVSVGLDKIKAGLKHRHAITPHILRKFAKTIISDQVSQDYSEWFLGHKKSTYYQMKEPMRREIYASRCMKYLTFLDYSALENVGKSVEKKLSQKDEEIEGLKSQIGLLMTAMHKAGLLEKD